MLTGCSDWRASSNLLDGKYVATPVSAMPAGTQTKTDFRDDNYYYYIFYLGKLENVPLQTPDQYQYYRYSGNNYTRSFTTTYAETQTIEEQSSYATSVTEEQYHEASVTAGIEVTASAGAIFAKAETTVSVETGYTGGWNKSTNDTWTNSYTKAETFSVENAETIEFSFDSSCAEGYYRYILFGTLDVYTVVIYDPATEQYELNTFSVIVAQGFDLDYSASSTFDDYEIPELPLEPSLLENLGYQPETYYSANELPPPGGNQPGALKVKYQTVFNIANGQRDKKVTDNDGVLDYVTCDFDIEALKTAGYTSFNLRITFDIKEVNDGYQDLWIMKNHTRYGTEWHHQQYDHLGGGSWGIGYEANKTIAINDFANQFTLHWGANGQKTDTWWLGTTYVYVEAVK